MSGRTTLAAARMGEVTWPGSVGADALAPALELEAFFVPTTSQHRSRCVDGRHNPDVQEGTLGPQAAGGAPGAAIAWRLAVDQDALADSTFVADAQRMVLACTDVGLSPGGHRDDSASGSLVGCGAIDGLSSVLDALTDRTLVADLKRLTRLLLGDDFDRDHFLRVLGAAVVLQGRSDSYFEGRGEVLTWLEERDPGSVPVLEGSHQETCVVVNLVPDTTLASNRYAQAQGTQAFGFDLWSTRSLATALLPGAAQQVEQARFLRARVMLTVATFMALTDGSLPLLIRDQGSISPARIA